MRNFEQIASDIAVRIFNTVNDERTRNPNGDTVSITADTEIGEIQESIINYLTAASQGDE